MSCHAPALRAAVHRQGKGPRLLHEPPQTLRQLVANLALQQLDVKGTFRTDYGHALRSKYTDVE
jgi:hypothetical protein